MIFSHDDIFDMVMRGYDVLNLNNLQVDHTVDIEQLADITEDPGILKKWSKSKNVELSVSDWDQLQQQDWYMPESYQNLDIAKYILSLCENDEQLQRCGQELLMYQEKNLFDLLRYLKYLVDVMQDNHVIWGVGRGSSVASYVLYLLKVHKIDSIYYDLDPTEFLR